MTSGQSGPSSPDSWVDIHGDDLYRYAYARVRDRGLAEDLVQETFLAALEAAKDFKGESSERTWLVAILRHKLVDHLRRTSRERASGGSSDQDDAGQSFDSRGMWRHRPRDWTPEASDLLEREEFWSVFQDCLSALPCRTADAFSLRVLEGLRGHEVCKILDVSATNLGVLLHRARLRLRNCLEAKWFSRPA